MVKSGRLWEWNIKGEDYQAYGLTDHALSSPVRFTGCLSWKNLLVFSEGRWSPIKWPL